MDTVASYRTQALASFNGVRESQHLLHLVDAPASSASRCSFRLEGISFRSLFRAQLQGMS